MKNKNKIQEFGGGAQAPFPNSGCKLSLADKIGMKTSCLGAQSGA